MNKFFTIIFFRSRPWASIELSGIRKDLRSFDSDRFAFLLVSAAFIILELTSKANATITEVVIENFNYEGHSYKAFTSSSQLTWSDAWAYAQSTGGDLVSLNTSAENTFVFNKIGTYTSFGSALWVQNGGDYYGPYIGLFQDPPSTQAQPLIGWKWVDNTSLNYNSWVTGQPDDLPPGINVAFYFNNVSKWGDTKDISTTTALAKALVVEYNIVATPAPAPFLGVFAAVNWARRLRRQIKKNTYINA